MSHGATQGLTILGMPVDLHILIMTWMVMAVVVLLAFIATRNLTEVPTGMQNVFEWIISALNGQVSASLGERGPAVAPFFVSLFLFILIANWWGLVPGMTSPTRSLNTNFGVAVVVVILLHLLGLYYKGFKYIKHFFEPIFPFVVINLLEEIVKPITLSFRLFGNILAGEVLIHILPQILPNVFLEVIPGVVWLGFSLFVGVIQAFIFTILSVSYFANAVKESED